MKSDKKFTAYLYQVVEKQDSKPLVELLKEVDSWPLRNRVRRVNGRDIRLEYIKKIDGLRYLDFGLLRFDNGPGRASKSTPVADFDLKSGEGFGEEAAAIYDPNSKFLVLQYNHHGARASSVASYLSALDDSAPNAYEFRLSLNDTAVARLKSKEIFTKVEMQVAPAKLSSEFRKNNVSLYSALVSQQKAFGGDVVRFVVSLERGNRSGTLSVKDKIKALLGLASNETDAVSTLQVSGKEDPGAKVDLVDLLEESRKTDFRDMTLSAGLRFPLEERLNRLRRAYNGWKREKVIS